MRSNIKKRIAKYCKMAFPKTDMNNTNKDYMPELKKRVKFTTFEISDDDMQLYKVDPRSSVDYYESLLLSIFNDDFNEPIHFHNDSDKVAILIEPIFDPITISVIKNFMYFMNPLGWNLLIIGFEGYKHRIYEVFPNCLFYKIADSMITFDTNDIPILTPAKYNEMLMNVNFWKSIPYKQIALFDRDSIMLRMFPEYISSMFDYVGANEYNKMFLVQNKPYTCWFKNTFDHHAYSLGGISSGFSLRNRDAMIDCLTKINWELIYSHKKITYSHFAPIEEHEQLHIPATISSMYQNENIFFINACELLKKRIPDTVHRSFLAIETDYCLTTCVLHGWTKNNHSLSFAKDLVHNSKLSIFLDISEDEFEQQKGTLSSTPHY